MGPKRIKIDDLNLEKHTPPQKKRPFFWGGVGNLMYV